MGRTDLLLSPVSPCGSPQVDSLPYQWLLVKNKTIMGPKSTEEQKVLLIPPQAGVYQCVLSVSSWPASAEPDLTGVRADVFAKRVVLVAVAENPALEVSPPPPSETGQDSLLECWKPEVGFLMEMDGQIIIIK